MLTWMGASEAEIRMYMEHNQQSGPWGWNFYTIQSECWLETAGVLSPLLLTSTMELINRKTSAKDILYKLLCVDDVAVVVGGKLTSNKAMLCSHHSFMRRPVHLSFRRVETVVDG